LIPSAGETVHQEQSSGMSWKARPRSQHACPSSWSNQCLLWRRHNMWWSWESSLLISSTSDLWPRRAFVLRVQVNSKGGVPPKSKVISASPPSWMST
ncbi:hypothetical protein KCV05_g77, partial [Aureobasidium melanogenum]